MGFTSSFLSRLLIFQSKKMASSDNINSLQVHSPGRINIIGEHTDYNDGFVLPAAIDKKMAVSIHKNGSTRLCHVTATNLDEDYEFNLEDFKPLESGWQNFVMGVVHELQKLGAKIDGFTCQFQGDVPIGAGMSSSAALECSLSFALNELFNLGFSKNQLIHASQMAEHNFVGIKCGIMDQFASMMGKKGQAVLLDCRTLEYKHFPLELGDYQLLLLNTNVSHTLDSSEYNTRRSECETGVGIVQKEISGVTHLRDVTLDQLSNFKTKMPEVVYRRCHHVVSENQRVLEATGAMSSGDFKKLGELVYQSHQSLQNDYEVSCPELDFLVKETLDKDYVLGARMMGGGFGGCTLNIIKKDKVDEFVKTVSYTYMEQFGIELTPYSVSIEGGTHIVDSQ